MSISYFFSKLPIKFQNVRFSEKTSHIIHTVSILQF